MVASGFFNEVPARDAVASRSHRRAAAGRFGSTTEPPRPPAGLRAGRSRNGSGLRGSDTGTPANRSREPLATGQLAGSGPAQLEQPGQDADPPPALPRMITSSARPANPFVFGRGSGSAGRRSKSSSKTVRCFTRTPHRLEFAVSAFSGRVRDPSKIANKHPLMHPFCPVTSNSSSPILIPSPWKSRRAAEVRQHRRRP
jgi:hypothetical protein